MDTDRENALFLLPTGTGQEHQPTDPWRWHSEADSASSTTMSRHLGTITENEWFHVLVQIISSTLLFILIFGVSATVDVRRLQQQAQNKFAILTGVATQFFIMPVLGYISVATLKGHGLTEPMAVSLLVVTASPGGSYSNWWCSMFNADLALSVTMTAISTMISCIMLPENLLLYVNAAFGPGLGSDGGEAVLENINWPSLFVSLAVVVLAIGTGLCASFKISSPRFHRFANRMGSAAGLLLIIFSAAVPALSGSSEAQIWRQPWSFYVGIVSPCFVGLFMATFLAAVARLRKPEVVSVGVECCYQNVGIATSAAVAMFDDPVERGQALCVPLFYGLAEGLLLGLYCMIGWKMGWTKAPRDEKFWVSIMKTYEVDGGVTEHDKFVDTQMDEEGQQESSNHTDTSWLTKQPSWRRPWTLLFGKIKRKGGDETKVAGDPLAATRVSLAHSTNESLESIVQIDAIANLVSLPAPPSAEYSRCRINSKDVTAVAAPAFGATSDGSANSFGDSSAADTPK